MGAIGFYIGLPFIYLISIIPFPLFYGVSDFFYVLLYYVIGYRKKVVYQNLKNSFPEKTHEELKTIERKFYRYLCDLFLETFKTLTISKKEAINRCAFTQQTTDLFNKLNDEKKSCIIVMGHYGNWEWAGNTFSLLLKQQLYVIYHPLTNKQFNNLMYKMRTRFGNKLYAMREVMREMIKNRNEINATAFIADQTPPPEGAYWTTFLNQDTPVFVGTEKIAQKLNYPIVYVTVSRPKRGHYLVNAEILVNEPKSTKEGEISELHTRRLEEDIKKQPEIWLWSHRRWKHKRPTA
ncbi:MAG: lysophospholipid acyltransferase family protein [Bacteroidetes bacterium]|nr:lysophospholipid acyltransferase family protein [Bacteroidota bacterium]